MIKSLTCSFRVARRHLFNIPKIVLTKIHQPLYVRSPQSYQFSTQKDKSNNNGIQKQMKEENEEEQKKCIIELQDYEDLKKMFISERRPIIVYFHNDEKDMVMFEEIIPMMKYFMNDKDDIKLVIVDVRKHEEAKLIRTVPHIFTVYGRTVVDEIVGLIDDFTFPLTLSLAKNIGQSTYEEIQSLVRIEKAIIFIQNKEYGEALRLLNDSPVESVYDSTRIKVQFLRCLLNYEMENDEEIERILENAEGLQYKQKVKETFLDVMQEMEKGDRLVFENEAIGMIKIIQKWKDSLVSRKMNVKDVYKTMFDELI